MILLNWQQTFREVFIAFTYYFVQIETTLLTNF